MNDYIKLNLEILYWMFIAPFRGQVFKFKEVIDQMIRIGVEALPMSALTSLSVGVTLAIQGADQFGKLGVNEYVPDLLMLSLLKGMGPLLIAVIVIGRSGSAVTAELGTMKVSEEIEALHIMAINPVRYLIVPRFIAMMIMLPCLTIIGIYIGMVGGWLICHFHLNQTTADFVMRSLQAPESFDLLNGMLKSVIFAWLIITIACTSGLGVDGGAEGVGKATTKSVAYSLIAILLANAFLTAVFVNF